MEDRLIITHDFVRQSLDNLINISTSDLGNPLTFLFIIDLYLIEHDLTFAASSRLYVLNNILHSIISGEYQRIRQVLLLPLLTENIDIESAILVIKSDAEMNNTVLMGWGWLYFRYVANVFEVSYQNYSEWVNVDERTLRRYQHYAIERLTEKLITLEIKAREQLRLRKLLSQLPRRGAIQLFGRETELSVALEAFAGNFASHILVGGPPGIGKTVFVEHTVKMLIDHDPRFVDHVVWIEHPPSLQFIEHTLKEQMLPPQSTLSLRELSQLKRVLIVVDDSSELQKNSNTFQSFLNEMHGIALLITTDIFDATQNCTQIVLREFSELEVRDFINLRTDSIQVDDSINDVISEVWKLVGGNPAAVLLVLQSLAVFDIRTAAMFSVDLLLGNLFSSLDAQTASLWFITSMVDKKSLVLPNYVVELWPNQIRDVHFTNLVRVHLLELVDQSLVGYSLSTLGRHFIRNRYHSDGVFQYHVNAFIVTLNIDAAQTESASNLIERVLLTDWLTTDIEWQVKVANSLWRTNLRRGRWSIWRTILEKYAAEISVERIDLVLGFGICLRCLAQWQGAQEVFESVIQFTGRQGLFGEQFVARLELAALFRFKGDYAQAQSILTKLKTLRPEFEADIATEEVEIALDLGNVQLALQLIGLLPTSPRTQFLRLMAQVENGITDIVAIMALAEQILNSTFNNTAIQARVHSAIGRCYENLSDNNRAKAHYSLAVRLLEERDNDPYGLARAQTNLGAFLLRTGDRETAFQLLESAYNIQRVLKDHVGLAITRHNLQHYRNMFAN